MRTVKLIPELRKPTQYRHRDRDGIIQWAWAIHRWNVLGGTRIAPA